MGNIPAPASSRTWQLQPCGSGFRVKDRRKEIWDKATEARHVSRVSLNGSLVEKLLYEAMKLMLDWLGEPSMLEIP